MKARTAVLLFAAALLVFVIVALLCPLRTPGEPNGSQIVLSFERDVQEPARTIKFFVPQGKIAFGLLPIDGPSAPLPAGSLSVCRMEVVQVALRFFDGKETGPVNEILFRCSGKRYLFTTLATVREKE